MLCTHRQTNSTLSSILLFELPLLQKETWTDISPISRIPSMHEPSVVQDQPCNLCPHSRPTSLSGPWTHQSHATCFGPSHGLIRPAHLRRSVWRLGARGATRSGHTGERAPNHACSSPDTPHTATSWNTRTRAMNPRSHPRLTYLYLFAVPFGTTMLDLLFFVVHNFCYSCFLPLIHVLALLSITSFFRLVLVLYVAMALRFY